MCLSRRNRCVIERLTVFGNHCGGDPSHVDFRNGFLANRG